jgi:hypothetical protein
MINNSKTNAESPNGSDEPVLGSKLQQQVETERARLTRAEGCLDCMRAAIDYIIEGSATDCDLSDLGDVADITRELVHETINRLDSINLDYPRRSPRRQR